jgi:translation initiation factor eIF-2B subunit delta
MAPLINTVGYIIGNISPITKNKILNRLVRFTEYRKEQMNALRAYFQEGLDQIYKPNLRIMLISHSSTINTVFSYYKEKDIIFYVLESRPLYEGRRTAEFFSNYFQTNLITDSAMGKFIKEIDVMFVGIDSILQDGTIINKIGTYPLAVLASETNKEIYAVGDSFKYNLRSHFGQEILIEKKPPEEIYESKGDNDNLNVKNYYFDKTPSMYITGIISDLGIHSPLNFVEEVKSHLNIQWFNRFV